MFLLEIRKLSLNNFFYFLSGALIIVCGVCNFLTNQGIIKLTCYY